MRKSNVLLGGAFILVVFSTLVFAAGRDGPKVLKTYLNEGNASEPYVVFASSETWTVLLSTGTRRRAAVLQVLETASGFVCTSTSSVQAACDANLPGLKLGSTGAGGSLNESSEEALFVRGESLKTGTSVYAKEYFDSADPAGQN